MNIKTIIVVAFLFIHGCSYFYEEHKTQLEFNKYIHINNTDLLKNYQSMEIKCGKSTFQFKAVCYDELEGLKDRGSSGGIRNYCEDIKLHIKKPFKNKILYYPIMPNYRVNIYKENGYTFDNRVNNETLTPETFSCVRVNNNKDYIFINNHFNRLSNNLTFFEKLNNDSVIIDTNGNYVSQNLSNILNNKEDSDIKVLKSGSTNIMYIGK